MKGGVVNPRRDEELGSEEGSLMAVWGGLGSGDKWVINQRGWREAGSREKQIGFRSE